VALLSDVTLFLYFNRFSNSKWAIFGLSHYCSLLNICYWEKAYILWRKNTEAFVVASKEIGLQGNADKTKCMVNV